MDIESIPDKDLFVTLKTRGGEGWGLDDELNELIRRYNNKKYECREFKKLAESREFNSPTFSVT